MYLITGSAGFIGFHLSLTLLKKGESVIGLDSINNYYDKKIKYDRLKILKSFKKFKFLKIDLSKQNTFSKKITKFINRIDVIIHLAGQAGVRYSIINPAAYINDNILSYVNLLECFKKSKKLKLILYASSSSVYGEKNSNNSFSSFPQINPISVYSASKLSMELISKSYNSLYSMRSIGIRFFSVYGPWGRPDMFYFKFLREVLKNKPVIIFNFGNHKRSFTYIDDVILNLLKIVNKFKNRKDNICDVFNIGNPNSISLKKLISVLESKIKKKAVKKYVKKNPEEVIVTKANIIREKKIFGHRINIPLEKGVEEFVNWYKKYTR